MDYQRIEVIDVKKKTLSEKTLKQKDAEKQQVKTHIKPFVKKYDVKKDDSKYNMSNKDKYERAIKRIGCMNL